MNAAAAHFEDIFIGLRYTVSGFEWIDGTVINYINFPANQPNTTVGNCVAMNVQSGLWRSVDCNQRMSFICLKEGNPAGYPGKSDISLNEAFQILSSHLLQLPNPLREATDVQLLTHFRAQIL